MTNEGSLPMFYGEICEIITKLYRCTFSSGAVVEDNIFFSKCKKILCGYNLK